MIKVAEKIVNYDKDLADVFTAASVDGPLGTEIVTAQLSDVDEETKTKILNAFIGSQRIKAMGSKFLSSVMASALDPNFFANKNGVHGVITEYITEAEFWLSFGYTLGRNTK